MRVVFKMTPTPSTIFFSARLRSGDKRYWIFVPSIPVSRTYSPLESPTRSPEPLRCIVRHFTHTPTRVFNLMISDQAFATSGSLRQRQANPAAWQ